MTRSRRPFGYFNGSPLMKLLPDGRGNRLMATLIYTDPQLKKWTAPKGFVSDGASIPQIFWTVVGGPWDGKYRYAAIVHDRYCETQSEPSDAVHRMFYSACRAGGLGVIESKLLYAAVRLGGPQWGNTARLDSGTSVAPAEIETWIRNTKPSLDEIDRFVSSTGADPFPRREIRPDRRSR